jgi:nucleoside 2-deoxyribosyltransferase
MTVSHADLIEVIMPIGSDQGYCEKQNAIRRGAQRAGFLVNFPRHPTARDFSLPQNDVERLRRASLVLADLSGERPSCYYELGIVEALHIPVVVFATVGSQIHQTSTREVEFYESLDRLEELVAELLVGAPQWIPLLKA